MLESINFALAIPYAVSVTTVPAFRDAIDVPLVVRRLHKSREEVHKRNSL